MESNETTTPQPNQEPQNEFEAIQERLLSAATEKVTERLRQCVKPDCSELMLWRKIN